MALSIIRSPAVSSLVATKSASLLIGISPQKHESPACFAGLGKEYLVAEDRHEPFAILGPSSREIKEAGAPAACSGGKFVVSMAAEA
jgi:hypothetical protein